MADRAPADNQLMRMTLQEVLEWVREEVIAVTGAAAVATMQEATPVDRIVDKDKMEQRAKQLALDNLRDRPGIVSARELDEEPSGWASADGWAVEVTTCRGVILVTVDVTQLRCLPEHE